MINLSIIYNVTAYAHDAKGLYPLGSPSRNSQRPELYSGPRGGLEIVFNQQ
ncbi:uncharacterized protein LOC109804697 [Cajanus cajan]|uniref:uncharacterized protein LOC109804697 n=1 Tax=Cajanus cajan TaxID=3821 RepID=UPI00098DA73B|nr:uncharacterized protein LOC109804697 [Cajanus cajan]